MTDASKPRRTKPPGRPAGASAEKAPVETIAVSRCAKCRSTERERYYRTREQAIAGVDRDGQPYTHVVWRWTRCKACRQVRVDRSYEYRPAQRRKAI